MPVADPSTGPADPDWAAFAALERMTNHWDRPGWRPGRTAYYWYLSFRDQDDVRALAAQCQAAVDAPHFDLVPDTDLHMTVQRVAFADEMDADALRRTEENTREALRGFGMLRLQIGPLAGSGGALSFSASPRNRLNELRSQLLTTAHSVGFAPDTTDADPFRPHVGIGYCNRTVNAAPIIEQVRVLRSLPPVDVRISKLTLVELTRHERAYSWDVVSEVPLTTDQ